MKEIKNFIFFIFLLAVSFVTVLLLYRVSYYIATSFFSLAPTKTEIVITKKPNRDIDLLPNLGHQIHNLVSTRDSLTSRLALVTWQGLVITPDSSLFFYDRLDSLYVVDSLHASFLGFNYATWPDKDKEVVMGYYEQPSKKIIKGDSLYHIFLDQHRKLVTQLNWVKDNNLDLQIVNENQDTSRYNFIVVYSSNPNNHNTRGWFFNIQGQLVGMALPKRLYPSLKLAQNEKLIIPWSVIKKELDEKQYYNNDE